MKKVIKGFFMLALVLVSSSKLFAQVNVSLSINIAPPALPVYTQPVCPVDGYLWVPGYWAYDNNMGDYYWVPGVWVSPPRPHYLWTPGYWAYNGNIYSFHPGYWGTRVGFYGGVNYGYGYSGSGYGGGRWVGNSFNYNTAVVNVNKTIVKNTYIDNTVIVNNSTTINNRSSFNGKGGITAKPRPEELAAMKEKHVQPTPDQLSHQQAAMANRSQHVSANQGKPAVTAYNKVNGDGFGQKGRPAKIAAVKNDANQQIDNAAKKTDAVNPATTRPAKIAADKNDANQQIDNAAKKTDAVNPATARPAKIAAVKNRANQPGDNMAKRPDVMSPVAARPKQPKYAVNKPQPVKMIKAQPARQIRQPAQHAERAREKQPREK
ncbi:YXWGXW repeat-containing protein [Mucilaginibacter rigui]|uniref:YXWGXW repeat-containing protein n=1 Tax=Mucilaginibacter rigui TaxID=534635 RepID=A0ABR7WZY8_9SPHI|nr:YXWGXW repeat-containing protein [Mucilaginibacter rigui]MBD1383891.1 YXWGXW repeat-containing protein [Mucilaginibacter rigui]